MIVDASRCPVIFFERHLLYLDELLMEQESDLAYREKEIAKMEAVGLLDQYQSRIKCNGKNLRKFTYYALGMHFGHRLEAKPQFEWRR